LPAVDQAELCQLLDAQVDHMTRLVTGLLDLARSEAGVLAVRAETRSVSDLLHETVRLLALGDRRVEFAVPEVLPLVEVDPLLIKQVIANLLENANRYSPPGTPIIIAVTNPPNTAVMEVSVTDHGVGLPLSQCGGLFDPFVRQGEGGRAGLGLAIAKAFVEAHRQRLWAENVSPSGARFVFTIPIARQEDAYE
jgi:two-component system sensor histidine kinase KdpD